MIKGVLFDAGGTLIRMKPGSDEIMYDMIQRYKITKEEFFRAFKEARKYRYRVYSKDSYSAFIQSILKNLGIEENIGEKIYDEIIKKAKFIRYPETLEVLKNLSRNYILGVISNWDLELNLNSIFEELRIRKYFSVIVVSKDIKISKPDPGIFLEALKKINLTPHQCFYIGDDPYEDFYGANNLGFISILIDRGNRYGELECPKIRDLREIYAYLEKDSFL